jgi:hypothetical protein
VSERVVFVVELGISATSSILTHQISNVEHEKETSTNCCQKRLALALVLGGQTGVFLQIRRHLKSCQLMYDRKPERLRTALLDEAAVFDVLGRASSDA